MEKIFTILAIIITLPATGQDLGKMPYHPFREIDGTYYSLQPIYDWYTAPPEFIGFGSEHRIRKDKPMQPMKAWKIVESAKVIAIVDAGLIVDPKFLHPQYGTVTGGPPTLVKNHPHQSKLSDGRVITFIALPGEPEKRGSRTYPVLDYGKPYDPAKR